MKKRFLPLMLAVCAMLVCASAAGAFAQGGTQTQPVSFSADESKWELKTGVSFDAGKGDMFLSGLSARAGSVAIGGNSTVKLTSAGNVANHSWSYHWILFKWGGDSPNQWQPNHIDETSADKGNWLALVYGNSSDSYIAECADGEVTKTRTDWSGNDTWYPHASDVEITIATLDTEEGVTAEISFKATGYSSNTGNTLTYTYKSANKALWGAQRFTVGVNGGLSAGAFSGEMRYNVEVTDIASDKVSQTDNGVDFALDASKWTQKEGVTFDDAGMHAQSGAYNVATVPVGGNSSVEVVLDSYVADGNWSFEKIMFKCDDPAAYAWMPGADGSLPASTGNWLAFIFGNNAQNGILYECVDGVVAEAAKVSSMSGYDNWHVHNQKNTVTLRAKDTAAGVEVTVTFLASDCRVTGITNTGNTYTLNYTSSNKKLWGEGILAIGRNGDGTVGSAQPITYRVTVKEKASDYSQDLYAAQQAEALIAALPEAVTADNYAKAKEDCVAARTAYDGLTAEQKALVTSAAKLTALEAALEEYEAGLGVAQVDAAIAALPKTVSKDNYQTAKPAIEAARAMYDALTEAQKAEVADKAGLDAALASLAAFETKLNAAEAADELIAAIPEGGVFRDNYEQMSALINAAAQAYDNLTTEERELVTGTAALEAAVAALEAYEQSLDQPVADSSNLAQSEENWNRSGNVSASNVSFDVYGMTIGDAANTTAMLLKKNVIADSKISLVFDGRAVASWGQLFVVFKNVGDELDAAAAITATDHGGITGAPAGTWMAFMFGNSYGIKLMECVDGVLTERDFGEAVNGSDWQNAIKQITRLTIETQDTATGVKVKISYTADGLSTVSGQTHTLEYDSENTVFHGDYALSVGAYYGQTAGSGERIVVSSLKVAGPDGGSGLTDRVIDDGLANHALSLDYWKTGANVDCFQFSDKGATLWDVTKAALVLNRKIGDNQTVTFELDGTLQAATYGNVYFVFKHKQPTAVYKDNFPAAVGDYLVLMLGGDGFKMYECADGVLNCSLDNGVVSGGVELTPPGHAGGPGNNNDVWYWYKQFTRVSITTKDVSDGVEVTVSIVGGDSGQTFTAEYFSENTALHGDSYIGVEYFLGAAGSSANGTVTLSSVKVSGVTEGFVPDYSQARIDEMNVSLRAANDAGVTAENREAQLALYETCLAGYREMNYTQGQAFAIDLLNNLKAKLDQYDSDAEAAAAVDEAIAKLPAAVDKDNYESAKTAIEAAESAYAALSDTAKGLVKKAGELTSSSAALDAFEAVKAAADAVDALIAAIPELGSDNYDEVKAAVEAAESAYANLSADQKELVARYGELTAARALVDENAPKEEGGCGCGGDSAAAGLMLTLPLLAGIFLTKRKLFR